MRPQSRTRRPFLAILRAIPPLILLFSTAAYAQGPGISSPPIPGPGLNLLPQPGIPFSGTYKIVRTKPLENGHTVTSYLNTKVIRDGQGRIYREWHEYTFDQNADPKATLAEFNISDPTSHTHTSCIVKTHICKVTDYTPPAAVALVPEGPSDGGRRWATRESLGTGKVESWSVNGTRETIRLSPKGTPKDLSIASIEEAWYSDALKINLSVTYKEPQKETSLMNLTDISAKEPDPTAFAIPSDYTVTDARHPAGSRSSN